MAAHPSWKGFVKLSLVAVSVKAYTPTVSGEGRIQLNQLHEECTSSGQPHSHLRRAEKRVRQPGGARVAGACTRVGYRHAATVDPCQAGDGRRMVAGWRRGMTQGRQRCGTQPAASNCILSKGIPAGSIRFVGRRMANDWRPRAMMGRRRCGRQPRGGSRSLSKAIRPESIRFVGRRMANDGNGER
jgi:hypothetical protein